MNELEWAKSVQELVSAQLKKFDLTLSLHQGIQLPYASEILHYKDKSAIYNTPISYETDLLVIEKNINEQTWKPRVVIETKFAKVSTHDAITYSEKALTHKRVHPYLRYGFLLGNRKHFPLPGRLFRHGFYFDFMLSWAAEKATAQEKKDLLEVLLDEVEASRNLEEMLYNSRKPSRKRYVVLHKPLRLK
jgi:hypothetical protein